MVRRTARRTPGGRGRPRLRAIAAVGAVLIAAGTVAARAHAQAAGPSGGPQPATANAPQPAVPPTAAKPDPPAAVPQAATRTHLVIVSGLGGSPEYVDAFYEWGAALADAAVERHGLPPEAVHFLAEDPARDADRIDARSTKEEVERVLRGVADRAGPDDRVVIVVFGHGNMRAGESRLNLPGPDMTPADFARAFDAFPTQTVVFANTASASGGFIEPLSGPNRLILTATRSGRERNATAFGGFFVEALTGDGADLDKDGRVSLLEAFRYARDEVERMYADDDRLLTEHALLDDDGDGAGSADPDPSAGDGALARALFLGAAPGEAAGAGDAVAAEVSPELRSLYERRLTLEARIEALRARRDSMDEADYRAELEALLLDLARTDHSIRELEGGTP